MRHGWFVLIALWPALAAAQEISAVRAARAHVESVARIADPGELRATHTRTDARTGLTTVTMAQYYEGVEVFGTSVGVAVARDGRVASPPPRQQARLSERAGPSEPTLPAGAAVDIAEAEARRTADQLSIALEVIPVVTDDPEIDRPRAPQSTVLTSSEPRLGYHPMADGSLRLAWEVIVSSETGPTLVRSVRVDALSGEVLSDLDLVAYDHWGHDHGHAGHHHHAEFAAPLAVRSPVFADAWMAPARAAANGPTYRVFAAPFESPSVGDVSLVQDPADPTASPLGWHRDGSRSYTITRGNNVHAYTDTDSDNAPDDGSAPDGGAGLVFDFEFNPSASPTSNADAAVTNLFYWNNVTHDVLYRYGFDAAAGNFQAQSNGGRGNDAVRAEALDGSGTNNANFGTPPDGGAPRMQMFRWTGTSRFSVTVPSGIAGSYPSGGAQFGPSTDFSGTLLLAQGPAGETTGCPAEGIVNDLTGRVALLERGGCLFVEKVLEAQQAGAAAAIVYNRPVDPGTPNDNGGEAILQMGGEDPRITIPSALVQRSTGLLIRQQTEPVDVAVERLADRSSSFDAGVVVHEYVHGLSNRLIGGAGDVSCLTNGFTSRDNPAANRAGEQMGEGWSDWYGIMLTQREGDTGPQPRGVGTYLRFEEPSGRGIRNAPYSTDFAINDYTYQDLIDHAAHSPSGPRGLSIPHGVGFVWATMLWEMTWELIGAHGFSPNIADADGTAGNQVALNLVTTGLKLTSCTPGFVDGRDAILAADQALYGGAHTDLIWRAFARRGLGVNASQGSSQAHTDGRASFVAPGELGAIAFSQPGIATQAGPGESRAFEVEITNARATTEPFTVGQLPPWLAVTPASGTIPAQGSASLTVTVAPTPLDTGRLTTTLPVSVGQEDSAIALSVEVDTDGAVDGAQLSVIGPNPSSDRARFTLAVGTDQTVRVLVADALGRVVIEDAVAFDADVRQTVALDVASLATGVYVVRVEGETFAETRTMTVVR
ncbi:MAG: M36 family metallopeptidase [Bacteroidota bacterium]